MVVPDQWVEGGGWCLFQLHRTVEVEVEVEVDAGVGTSLLLSLLLVLVLVPPSLVPLRTSSSTQRKPLVSNSSETPSSRGTFLRRALPAMRFHSRGV